MPDLPWPYGWLFTRTRAARARGPERARALLDDLGAPDRAFDSVRVVGTNGKGSVSAMLEAGLIAAGARVGRFTSPHLERFEERVRVQGQDIPPEVTANFTRWAQAREPDASFFDLTLALAAQVFAGAGVRWAVMEAGVGGASDATQALARVRAVLITNVALDHTATLGATIPEIARDKAGAARPGVPLLTTATGEALEVIAAVAQEVGAPLFTPATHPALFALPRAPALPGAHQRANAALALAALRALGFGAGADAALDAAHPARLERFEVAGRRVWLDGAHNPHAALALAAAVGRADALLFGNFARKDTEATLAPLLALAPMRVFTAPGEGASDPTALARAHDGVAEPEPARALTLALDRTPPGGTLLVTGSLYLAGLLRPALLEQTPTRRARSAPQGYPGRMSELSFEQKLQNYADLTVRVGAGLRAGQRLLVQSPVETAPLARAIVRAAYAAGASQVDVRWDDDDVVLARYELAPADSFETISRWRVDAELEVANAGGTVISIRATDPNLLSRVDPARVAAQQRALASYRSPYMQMVRTNALNWNLVSAPVPAWAARMFPDASPEDAVRQQWDAIFMATRADTPDPIAAWTEHLAALSARKDRLNARQFAALHFTGGGTDLTVGLSDHHVWAGGSSRTPSGIEFVANVPTEEVFTAPHRERVEGVVASTKPLSYNGVLIDGIRIRFEGGRVVEASAQSGEAVLKQLIDTDEGSHRLGEVALVPHSSPISRSGLFFFNTLYDENAASHIAIGAAYRFNIQGGEGMSSEAFAAQGGNESLTHVDWMIGSADINVDGVTTTGEREPVMRAGEFVI